MDLDLKELSEYITNGLGGDIQSTSIELDELVLTVPKDSIIKVMTYLRDDANCQFKQMMDICGVDYPERDPRFCVVYNMLSLKHNRRVRIKVWTNEDEPVPSVISLFSSANWFEREAWDMFGIYFSGHTDLRRLLSDYGFEGHPLRKDFPLTGYVEVRYDDEQKRIVYEPVKLTQDFRTFDFLSPWEGAAPLLPDNDQSGDSEDKGAS